MFPGDERGYDDDNYDVEEDGDCGEDYDADEEHERLVTRMVLMTTTMGVVERSLNSI